LDSDNWSEGEKPVRCHRGFPLNCRVDYTRTLCRSLRRHLHRYLR
jgi:hypothetical protein